MLFQDAKIHSVT